MGRIGGMPYETGCPTLSPSSVDGLQRRNLQQVVLWVASTILFNTFLLTAEQFLYQVVMEKVNVLSTTHLRKVANT